MSARPRIIHSDNVYRIAYWENVVIVDVAGDLDVERMKRVGKAYQDLLAERPEGIAVITLLRPGVPVGSSAAREESQRFIKALGDNLHRVALVIEDKGMVSQLLQTVVRGINVVTRSQKLQLVSGAPQAVAAVAPFVQGIQGNPEAALTAAVAATRAGFPPAARASA